VSKWSGGQCPLYWLYEIPQQWPFSSLHRLGKENMYPLDWGSKDKMPLEEVGFAMTHPTVTTSYCDCILQEYKI
jgi:hypothetical protein